MKICLGFFIQLSYCTIFYKYFRWNLESFGANIQETSSWSNINYFDKRDTKYLVKNSYYWAVMKSVHHLTFIKANMIFVGLIFVWEIKSWLHVFSKFKTIIYPYRPIRKKKRKQYCTVQMWRWYVILTCRKRKRGIGSMFILSIHIGDFRIRTFYFR